MNFTKALTSDGIGAAILNPRTGKVSDWFRAKGVLWASLLANKNIQADIIVKRKCFMKINFYS
jgi:hypothetical protein